LGKGFLLTMSGEKTVENEEEKIEKIKFLSYDKNKTPLHIKKDVQNIIDSWKKEL
jgi:hypothetical protein